MGRLKVYKDYTTICSPAPSEVLALIAVQNWQSVTARTIAIVGENIKIWKSFLQRHPNLVKCPDVVAGTVCFPEWLPASIDGDVSLAELCQDVLKKCSLMLLPSTCYDYQAKYFRVGLGRKNFAEALKVFDGYLNEHLPALRAAKTALVDRKINND